MEGLLLEFATSKKVNGQGGVIDLRAQRGGHCFDARRVTWLSWRLWLVARVPTMPPKRKNVGWHNVSGRGKITQGSGSLRRGFFWYGSF